MKKKTRRKFLCDMMTMSFFGSYGCLKKNLPGSNKNAARCSKILSRHKAIETEEKIFKDTEPLFANIELSTVAKIINVYSYDNPGHSPFQISVECKAFDDFGAVHNVDLVFFPEKIGQRDRIIEDLKADSIYSIKGGWTMLKDYPITFFSPDYKRIEPEHLENQMKKMFKIFEDMG